MIDFITTFCDIVYISFYSELIIINDLFIQIDKSFSILNQKKMLDNNNLIYHLKAKLSDFILR